MTRPVRCVAALLTLLTATAAVAAVSQIREAADPDDAVGFLRLIEVESMTAPDGQATAPCDACDETSPLCRTVAMRLDALAVAGSGVRMITAEIGDPDDRFIDLGGATAHTPASAPDVQTRDWSGSMLAGVPVQADAIDLPVRVRLHLAMLHGTVGRTLRGLFRDVAIP